MAGLMPWYILREWDNSGRLLSGGFLYFFESGTNVPKPTYTDYTLTVPNTNPVQLDAGGAADIFLGDGAYRVLVTNAQGVQIRAPIDGIAGISNGLGPGSNISFVALEVYNDLRGLSSAPDFVYISGRENEGDGGQGMFQLIPGSTATDDDGIILTNAGGTNVYKRIFSGFLDPRWYGLVYDINSNQSAAFAKVVTGSAVHNVTAQFLGQVYTTANLIVTAGASLRFELESFVHAGSALSMTMRTGSRFEGLGIVFGANINPVFEESVVDVVKLSWMGGQTGDEKLAKLAACSAGSQDVGIDVSMTVDTFPTFPQRLGLDNLGGVITIAAASAFSANVVYTGVSQFISYTAKSNITTVNVGPRAAKPEWFGAVGDNTADDSVPMQAAVKNERVELRDTASYRILQQLNCPPVVTFYGRLAAAMSVNAPINDVTDVPTPRLFLDPPSSLDVLDFATAGQLALVGVGLAMGGNAAVDAGTVNGTFNAIGSVIFATNATGTIKAQHVSMSNTVVNTLDVFTASDVDLYLDNVRDDSNYARRKFHHDSSFKDVYLEEILKTTNIDRVLTTDNVGKVIGTGTLTLESLTVFNMVTESEALDNVTYIEVEIYDNIGTQAYRVRRDGVQIAGSTSTPAYIEYQIRADDKPTIVVKYYGVTSGIPVYVVPANKPSDSDVLRIISIGNNVYVGNGTVSPCWNQYRVALNGDALLTSGNRMACNGYYYAGKWSIG